MLILCGAQFVTLKLLAMVGEQRMQELFADSLDTHQKVKLMLTSHKLLHRRCSWVTAIHCCILNTE